MNNLLNDLQVTIDPLAVISLAISTIVGIYIMHIETRTPLIKARHEQLIAPLFFMIEPYLYQSENPDNIFEILSIIESNRNIADGKLLECYYWCCNECSHSFYDLCAYVDKLYDKSCKQLKLKCRPILYRINRKQYKSVGHLIWLIFKYSLPHLLLFIICLFVFMLIFCLLTSTANSANTQLLCISILLLLLIFLYRYTTTN